MIWFLRRDGAIKFIKKKKTVIKLKGKTCIWCKGIFFERERMYLLDSKKMYTFGTELIMCKI